MLAALFVFSACGSKGCNGCDGEAIPGGFPAQHRIENAVQVRLSKSGLQFLENNFETVATSLAGGSLSFDIPQSSSGDEKICDGGSPCSVALDFTSVKVSPLPKGALTLDLRSIVKSTKIKYEKKVWLIGWISCDVSYDTTRSGSQDLQLQSEIDFQVDPENGKKLTIVQGTTKLNYFEIDDLKISGGLDCSIANYFKGEFENEIKKILSKAVDDSLDGMLKDLPMGFEERLDATVSDKYSVANSVIDATLWGGGYAIGEQGGLTLGAMGGVRATAHHPCVQDCEKPGATCSRPSMKINRSKWFSGNLQPDGKPFHVGIGIPRATFEHAAYEMYRSGWLCYDISSEKTDTLSAGILSALIPSLIRLTGGKNVPVNLVARPAKPPRVELGKGTYHKEKSGEVVIDVPHVKVTIPDYGIHLLGQIDERMIRIFSAVMDLEVKAVVAVGAGGELQPVLSDLTKAATNIRIDTGLLAEDPQDLAKLVPMMVAIVVSNLPSDLPSFKLPSTGGITLLPNQNTITAVDNNSVLGIFATASLMKTTSGTMTSEQETQVETQVELERVQMPPSEAFRLGPRFDPASGPAVTLAMSAAVSGELADQPLEYSYRVDGGLFRPFTQGPRVTIRDPRFWLQGRHIVEVTARIEGRPETRDPTPVQVPVVIDSVPPKVRLVRTGDRVRAEIHDVSRLRLSWSVAGGPFGPFVDARSVEAPRGAAVEVRVKDEGGNLARATAAAVLVASDPSAGGCAMARRSGALPGLLLILLVPLLLLRLRKNLGPTLLVLVFGLMGLAGCPDNGTAAPDAGGDAQGSDMEIDTQPPPPHGAIGRFSAAAEHEGLLMASGYEEKFGDLVLVSAKTSDLSQQTIEIIDGVPEAAPSKPEEPYRGGVTEPGEDVGQDTDIAVSSTGRVMISYRDVTNEALKLAIKSEGGWSAQTVQARQAGSKEVVGRFNSLVFIDDKPAIAYLVYKIDSTGGGLSSELRWAESSKEVPGAESDWTIQTIDASPTPETDSKVDDIPKVTGLWASALVLGTTPFVVYYDRTQGNLKVAYRSGESWTATVLKGTASDDVGAFCSAAVGAAGMIHVAYQDVGKSTLNYLQVSTTPLTVEVSEVIDNGIRMTGRHEVGADSAIAVDDSSKVWVIYQDGWTTDLLLARRTGDTWTPNDATDPDLGRRVLGGPKGYGFYSDLVLSGDKALGSTFYYQGGSGLKGGLELFAVP